jgi:hypothetical protein
LLNESTNWDSLYTYHYNIVIYPLLLTLLALWHRKLESLRKWEKYSDSFFLRMITTYPLNRGAWEWWLLLQRRKSLTIIIWHYTYDYGFKANLFDTLVHWFLTKRSLIIYVWVLSRVFKMLCYVQSLLTVITNYMAGRTDVILAF